MNIDFHQDILRMITFVTIADDCMKSSPCQHDCTLRLTDGREVKVTSTNDCVGALIFELTFKEIGSNLNPSHFLDSFCPKDVDKEFQKTLPNLESIETITIADNCKEMVSRSPNRCKHNCTFKLKNGEEVKFSNLRYDYLIDLINSIAFNKIICNKNCYHFFKPDALKSDVNDFQAKLYNAIYAEGEKNELPNKFDVILK